PPAGPSAGGSIDVIADYIDNYNHFGIDVIADYIQVELQEYQLTPFEGGNDMDWFQTPEDRQPLGQKLGCTPDEHAVAQAFRGLQRPPEGQAGWSAGAERLQAGNQEVVEDGYRAMRQKTQADGRQVRADIEAEYQRRNRGRSREA